MDLGGWRSANPEPMAPQVLDAGAELAEPHQYLVGDSSLGKERLPPPAYAAGQPAAMSMASSAAASPAASAASLRSRRC